jgi:hypothetical protein
MNIGKGQTIFLLKAGKSMVHEQHPRGLYGRGLEYPGLAGFLFSICRIKP